MFVVFLVVLDGFDLNEDYVYRYRPQTSADEQNAALMAVIPEYFYFNDYQARVMVRWLYEVDDTFSRTPVLFAGGESEKLVREILRRFLGEGDQ